MLKNNPMVKRIVETGEERVSKLTQQLLANEKFVATVQALADRVAALEQAAVNAINNTTEG